MMAPVEGIKQCKYGHVMVQRGKGWGCPACDESNAEKMRKRPKTHCAAGHELTNGTCVQCRQDWSIRQAVTAKDRAIDATLERAPHTEAHTAEDYGFIALSGGQQ